MFIYIHLPFCLSKCIYCDFYVTLKGDEARRKVYLTALLQEIEARLAPPPNLPRRSVGGETIRLSPEQIVFPNNSPLPDREGGRGVVNPESAPSIQTVYFGGGTPALFTAEEIGQILQALQNLAPMAPDAEITLEANPDHMASPTKDYLEVGVNRISIGVQSMQPNELKRLSRVHSVADVRQVVQDFQAAGCQNISVDLMYGIPEQTAESWERTLQAILAMGVQHISMYGLKVEENTALAKVLAQGRMTLPPEDDTVAFYQHARRLLQQAGFEGYEFSNFARAGFASRHNLAYWTNQDFWGFGVSAHGLIEGIRTEHVRDLEAYQADPLTYAVTEVYDQKIQRENALIFGLRLAQGVDIPDWEARYQSNFQSLYGQHLDRYADYFHWQENRLTLSEDAIPLSNSLLEGFLH